MNIESANIAPKSLGNNPARNNAARDNGNNADDFSSALKGQEKLFQGSDVDGDAKGQTQATAAKTDTPEVKQVEDNQNEIADFIGQFFPDLTSKNTDFQDITLVAPPSEAQQNLVAEDTHLAIVDQEMGDLLSSIGVAAEKPTPVTHQVNAGADDSTQEISLKNTLGTWQSSQFKPETTFAKESAPESFTEAFNATTESNFQTSESNTTASKMESALTAKPVETRVEYIAIAKPVSHPGWSKDLGEHIIWMNNKAIPAAEIKMNPEHLGPISIRIDVSNDNQTSILFTAQHVEAKEALEASIPKLREMLNNQQLNLVNVNISQNPGSHQNRAPAQPFHNSDGQNNTSQVTDPIEPGHAVSKGLLSLYA